jgi:hypothetical protein
LQFILFYFVGNNGVDTCSNNGKKLMCWQNHNRNVQCLMRQFLYVLLCLCANQYRDLLLCFQVQHHNEVTVSSVGLMDSTGQAPVSTSSSTVDAIQPKSSLVQNQPAHAMPETPIIKSASVPLVAIVDEPAPAAAEPAQVRIASPIGYCILFLEH